MSALEDRLAPILADNFGYPVQRLEDVLGIKLLGEQLEQVRNIFRAATANRVL